jgi:hypothetical protein
MEGRYELMGVQATVNDLLDYINRPIRRIRGLFWGFYADQTTKQFFTANSWELLVRVDILSLRLFFTRTFACLASLLDADHGSGSCRLQMGRSDVGREGGREGLQL